MFSHNILRGLQGGFTKREHNDDTYNLYYHAALIGQFNVTLGVSSIVEHPAITATSNIFLMPTDSAAAGLATAIGYSVAAGVGSFTATHGSAIATAGVFNYLVF
jgi:hypothetical protein